MSAQLRRIAVLKFYVSWLVSLTLLTLLRRPMGWALASWVTGDNSRQIAVGTVIADCPPHGPGRALISASGSYLG